MHGRLQTHGRRELSGSLLVDLYAFLHSGLGTVGCYDANRIDYVIECRSECVHVSIISNAA